MVWWSIHGMVVNPWPGGQPIIWWSTHGIVVYPWHGGQPHGMVINPWHGGQPMAWWSTHRTVVNPWYCGHWSTWWSTPSHGCQYGGQPIAWCSTHGMVVNPWYGGQPMVWWSTHGMLLNPWYFGQPLHVPTYGRINPDPVAIQFRFRLQFISTVRPQASLDPRHYHLSCVRTNTQSDLQPCTVAHKYFLRYINREYGFHINNEHRLTIISIVNLTITKAQGKNWRGLGVRPPGAVLDPLWKIAKMELGGRFWTIYI